MTVSTRRVGDVAFVELNNPPVNAIGLSVRQGLQAAIDWVNTEVGLSRVVLSGAGKAFAAGGDAKEFDGPPIAPHLPDLVNQIELSSVPWIAALNGVALGGGCELALGCCYRIAKPGIQIGLPEVTLGVVPGASGTQRLPRLIGLKAALDMIATGRPVSSEKAEELGLVDGISDDPIMLAQNLDIGTLDLAPTTGTLPKPEIDAGVLAGARDMAAKKMAKQESPLVAIDLVEKACSLELIDALPIEREAFIRLRTSDQAKALRHIFFAERAAKAPGWLMAEPKPVTTVAVVGGGTMGAGIAYAFLNAGFTVVLIETDAEGVERATNNVEKIISASLKRGLISEQKAADHRSRISYSFDYADTSACDLAVEAAFESMDVKHAVFQKLAAHMAKDAILATNTSYLDINEIASVLDDPSRLVGLHFFAPAHIMKLLEIIRADKTSDEALATGFALAKRLRKIPVLARVCDGFIGNRILARYREAADTVMMDSSNPWEMDEAMVDFGYAMGPYEAQDLSGLDIAFANRRRQDATRDPNRRYIPVADRMVNEGRLGKKVGVGWYRYPGGGGKVDDPLVEDLVAEEAHFAKVERVEVGAHEIRERLLLAMINEAAAILDEGIAESACDIDLVTVFGYGFPRWRGGLMHYADTIGPGELVAKLKKLAEEDPIAWVVSPMLQYCADNGVSIADYRGAKG